MKGELHTMNTINKNRSWGGLANRWQFQWVHLTSGMATSRDRLGGRGGTYTKTHAETRVALLCRDIF